MSKAGKHNRNGIFAGCMLLADVLCCAVLIRGGHLTILHITERLELAFAVDGLTRFVLPAVMMLYTAVLFYAFEYMEHGERQNVFFTFYLISFCALSAVCLSANLVTMYLCFELLTLSTVPLVLHELSGEAVAAGLKYLFYSMGGALMGLLAVFYVYQYTSGNGTFVMGGFLDDALLAGHEKMLLAVVMTGIIGFGTKAGMYPMHGWLPAAHPIAPAPASSLLSGIVAKAGVIAIIRLIYYSVGARLLQGTWVQKAWMTLALLTVFMGSMMAFGEKNLKKRLAYSTISQISYILLGLSLLDDRGLAGGLIHLMGHCAAKGCLFLVAGVFIYRLGIRDVRHLKGTGRRMPVTMVCFTIASLSLVGIPPLAGFTSKWAIASAAIAAGIPVYSLLIPVMLLISALLTAGYLLPITVDAFFPGDGDSGSSPSGSGETGLTMSAMSDREPGLRACIPMILLCCSVLITGLCGSGIAAFCGFTL